jgi:ABC-type transporter Mla subunit MlaD
LKGVSRTDLYVGIFITGAVAVVATALIVTSGWNVDRYDLYIRTNDATDVTVDTKIFLRGFELGRVAAIEPRPSPTGRGVEFVIRASVLARFPDGSELTLPRGAVTEVVQGVLGGSTISLVIHDTIPGNLAPGDTIEMTRRTPAMEAFGSLATDLRGTILDVLNATTQTLNSARRLADSLTLATGTARRFVAGIQPGTEQTLAEAATSLRRLQTVLDSTSTRSGVTLAELNQTMRHTRQLIASADSLTRTLTAMGGENVPEIRQILVNTRQLSEQLQYVMEQLGRRPMRVVTGVTIPESLTVDGRARRAADSVARDSSRRAGGGTRP